MVPPELIPVLKRYGFEALDSECWTQKRERSGTLYYMGPSRGEDFSQQDVWSHTRHATSVPGAGVEAHAWTSTPARPAPDLSLSPSLTQGLYIEAYTESGEAVRRQRTSVGESQRAWVASLFEGTVTDLAALSNARLTVTVVSETEYKVAIQWGNRGERVKPEAFDAVIRLHSLVESRLPPGR